jgi:hypothetical protein
MYSITIIIAVYSVRTWDESTRKSKTQLEAVAINTTSTRKLTTSSLAVEASPVFSPDGNHMHCHLPWLTHLILIVESKQVKQ